MRLRLLQDGGQHVADVRLVTLRALHVDHRGLQHAPERRRLLGLAIAAARQVLDRFVEVVVQFRRSAVRSAPHAARMRSPSVSCSSA